MRKQFCSLLFSIDFLPEMASTTTTNIYPRNIAVFLLLPKLGRGMGEIHMGTAGV